MNSLRIRQIASFLYKFVGSETSATGRLSSQNDEWARVSPSPWYGRSRPLVIMSVYVSIQLQQEGWFFRLEMTAILETGISNRKVPVIGCIKAQTQFSL